jgi:hypothetical protein
LGKNHIRVAQVSPGLVETEFAFAMNPGNPEKAEKLYSSMNCIKVTPIYNVKSDSYLAKNLHLAGHLVVTLLKDSTNRGGRLITVDRFITSRCNVLSVPLSYLLIYQSWFPYFFPIT